MLRNAKRLTTIGLAAGAMALGLLAHQPAMAEVTKLRVSTIPIIDTAPLQAAIAKGFFTAEGLEIDTTPTAGGAVGLPALAAGQVQIAFSNIISIVLGAKQGLGFEIIAAGSDTGDKAPDLAGLIAKKGSTLKTGKDLEGKTLAVNTRNNIIWLYARAWVGATGGNPDKVTYLEVPFPQMVDATAGGRVDAAFVVEPFYSAGVAGGAVQHVAWPYNTVQKNIPVAQYVATKSYIAANPGVIDKFSRAYNKGVDWVNQNKGSDEWVQIVAGYTRLKPEQIKGHDLVLDVLAREPVPVEQVPVLRRASVLRVAGRALQAVRGRRVRADVARRRGHRAQRVAGVVRVAAAERVPGDRAVQAAGHARGAGVHAGVHAVDVRAVGAVVVAVEAGLVDVAEQQVGVSRGAAPWIGDGVPLDGRVVVRMGDARVHVVAVRANERRAAVVVAGVRRARDCPHADE